MKKIEWPGLKNVTNTRIASLVRNSENPYRTAHLQSAFKLKEPKINFDAPKANLSSPWTMMKGSK